MSNEKEKAEVTIANFLSKVRHYYHASEVNKIESAFNLANKAHQGQFRASGRAYITHPTTVADILIDMGFDVSTICAALLHDTVEDTYITNDDISKKFGEEIAILVSGVTKLDKIKFHSKEEEQAENMRKMFFAMAKDTQPQNDFVFTIICEELGFFGAAAIILLFFALVARGVLLGSRAPDKFTSLVIYGLTFKLAIHVFLNVGVVSGMLPNTGISLPFFSSGGSATISQMIDMGIILGLSRFCTQKK